MVRSEARSIALIVVILIIVYLMITAWNQVLSQTMFRWLKLDHKKTSSWAVIAIVATVILAIMVKFFKKEAHDVLGFTGKSSDTQDEAQAEDSD